jgi:hypothetical protein
MAPRGRRHFVDDFEAPFDALEPPAVEELAPEDPELEDPELEDDPESALARAL